jgi:hypothetical protein
MAKYGDVTVGQTEAVVNRMGGFDNWLRYAGGQGKIVFDSLLTHVRTWKAPAQGAVTTSRKYWEDAGVKRMGIDFEVQFLDLEVPAVESSELAIAELEEDSPDTTIFAELGSHAETAVSHFREFLRGYEETDEWFIFYLRGKDGHVWAVNAGWDSVDGGWYVYADMVTALEGGDAGDLVVSRK